MSINHDVCRQARFEKAEREKRNARILHVAALDPDLTLVEMSERFGISPDAIRKVIGAADAKRRGRPLISEAETRRINAPFGFSFCGQRKFK